MPQIIESPSVIEAAGNMPKIIEEYFGRVNTNSDTVSIARMKSPKGWIEPGQKPEFDEYTIVLKGVLQILCESAKIIKVKAGSAVLTKKGEWVKYSTPDEDTEYIAVCLPAFSSDTVNRDIE